MLLCKYASQKPGRMEKIHCEKNGGLCGHAYLCEISMKFKQTEQAARCPLQRENKKRETRKTK